MALLRAAFCNAAFCDGCRAPAIYEAGKLPKVRMFESVCRPSTDGAFRTKQVVDLAGAERTACVGDDLFDKAAIRLEFARIIEGRSIVCLGVRVDGVFGRIFFSGPLKTLKIVLLRQDAENAAELVLDPLILDYEQIERAVQILLTRACVEP